MSEMKHTPTPWTQYMHGPMIHGADGFYIGIMQGKNADKDAAYTVECVNSHASLVEENARLREACTALLASWDKGDGQERRGEFEGVEYWSPAGRMIDTEFIAAIREALK